MQLKPPTVAFLKHGYRFFFKIFCVFFFPLAKSKSNTNPENSKLNTNPKNSKSNITYSQYKHTEKIQNQTQHAYNTNMPRKFKIKYKPRKFKIKHNILTTQTRPESSKLNTIPKNSKSNTNPENSKSNTTYSQYKHT